MSDKNEKVPYNMYYKIPGGAKRKLKEQVWAVSNAQAEMLFRKQYPYVLDYYQMGEVWVEIDQDKLKEVQQAKEYRKQREEEIVENAWWNK